MMFVVKKASNVTFAEERDLSAGDLLALTCGLRYQLVITPRQYKLPVVLICDGDGANGSWQSERPTLMQVMETTSAMVKALKTS